MAIIQNQKHGTVVIRDTATNSSITLANLATPNSTVENVTSLAIKQIFFTSDGQWVVARGSNTIAVLPGTGHWNLAGHGVTFADSANATLSYTLTGNGTIVIVGQKTSEPIV